MKNKNKYIIIGLIVLIIVWLVWKRRKGTTAHKTAGTTTSGSSGSLPISSGGSTSTSSGCTNTTVLKRGTICDRVQWSQYKINQAASMLGIARLADDGNFGSKTESAFLKVLGKKTGTWNEVNDKVNALLHNALMSTNNGWTYADGTPVY